MNETEFFEGIEMGRLPAEFAKFKEKWQTAANEITEQPYYYVKNAYIRFEYKGNSYIVGSGSLDISNELFEKIERDIEADLKAIGAEKICYCGMID